jgi:hypothetical protein
MFNPPINFIFQRIILRGDKMRVRDLIDTLSMLSDEAKDKIVTCNIAKEGISKQADELSSKDMIKDIKENEDAVELRNF